jgi:hypothetical protein
MHLNYVGVLSVIKSNSSKKAEIPADRMTDKELNLLRLRKIIFMVNHSPLEHDRGTISENGDKLINL